MLSQPQQRIDVTDNPLFSPGGPDRPPRPAAWCCALLQQAWQWIAFTCRRGPVPVCLVTCLWLLAATAGASVTPPAIRLLEEKHPPGVQWQGLVMGRRHFTVRTGALRQLIRRKSDRLLLPVAGKEMLFRAVARQYHRNRTTTWIGRSEDGSTSLLTMGRDRFFARVVRKGRVIVFRPSNGTMIAETLDPDMATSLDDDIAFPAASLPAAAADAGVPTTSLPAAAGAAAAGERIIDVMVLYTPGMLQLYPGDTIMIRIQHLVDLANQAFGNSGIHVRFRLVHIGEKEYADTGSMYTALDDLTGNRGVFSDVELLRDLHGADQVTLLRRYVDAGCGLAWIMQSDDARHAYAVVHDGQRDDGYYCDDLTYIHEVGHNLGCAHDRDHAGFVRGMYDYSYGYQFQAGASWYRTIMSYDCAGGCQRITYFSNPAVLYNGVPTGRPAGTPAAADNGDTINRTSYLVQAYRPATDPDLAPSQTSLAVPGPATEVGTVAHTDPALYIENHGQGYLQIGQVGQGLAPPFSLDSDSCSNREIAPSWLDPAAPEHCSIRLRFEPRQPGVYSAFLEIPSNDPDTPRLRLAVSGTAESTPPWISVSPTRLSFGRVTTGGRAELELLLANRGRQELQIGSIAGPGPFSILLDGCSGQTLATDQTCRMRIGFAPADSERYQDHLQVPSNDPLHDPLLVPLRGGPFPWNLYLPAILRQ